MPAIALPTPVVAVVGPTAVGQDRGRRGARARDCRRRDRLRRLHAGLPRAWTSARPSRRRRQRRVPYHCLDLVDPGEPYSAALLPARRPRGDRRHPGARRVGRSSPAARGSTCARRSTTWSSRAGERGLAGARALRGASPRELGPEGLHALLAERDPASRGAHPPQQHAPRRARARDARRGRPPTPSRSAGFAGARSRLRRCIVGLDDGSRGALRAHRRAGGRDDRERVCSTRCAACSTAGYRDALTAAQAIGYKELVPVLEERRGPATRPSPPSSRRPAATPSASSTWFRADPRIEWLDVTGSSPADAADAARSSW